MQARKKLILFSLISSAIAAATIFTISSRSPRTLAPKKTKQSQVTMSSESRVVESNVGKISNTRVTELKVVQKSSDETSVPVSSPAVGTPQEDLENVPKPDDAFEVSTKKTRNIFTNEDKLRTKPAEVSSIQDFLKNRELKDPSENFKSGELLSGSFIDTHLKGTYQGLIKAEQDYELTLTFRNGQVVDNRFVGEIFVEIKEVNSSSKVFFWNDANRKVRVVTESGKESILIEFLARNLPAPNRMLQLLLIDGDDNTILGNLYSMNDGTYVRAGSFQLKNSNISPL